MFSCSAGKGARVEEWMRRALCDATAAIAGPQERDELPQMTDRYTTRRRRGALAQF